MGGSVSITDASQENPKGETSWGQDSRLEIALRGQSH